MPLFCNKRLLFSTIPNILKDEDIFCFFFLLIQILFVSLHLES